MGLLRWVMVAAVIILMAMPAGRAAETRVIPLTLESRSVSGRDVETAGGVGVVRVRQGEQVELRWISDETTELHLHGYNVTATVAADGEAVMRFEARAAGRFAIEGHGFGDGHDAGQTLLYLEVLPR